jgi:hypothetical protein
MCRSYVKNSTHKYRIVFLGATGVIYFITMHGINSVKACIVIMWKLSATFLNLGTE